MASFDLIYIKLCIQEMSCSHLFTEDYTVPLQLCLVLFIDKGVILMKKFRSVNPTPKRIILLFSIEHSSTFTECLTQYWHDMHTGPLRIS